MTAPTPEQMRALADRLDTVVRNEGLWSYEAEDVERSAATLRAAADQLEAVQNICDRALSVKVAGSTTADAAAAAIASAVKNAITPADTAPREDRND